MSFQIGKCLFTFSYQGPNSMEESHGYPIVKRTDQFVYLRNYNEEHLIRLSRRDLETSGQASRKRHAWESFHTSRNGCPEGHVLWKVYNRYWDSELTKQSSTIRGAAHDASGSWDPQTWPTDLQEEEARIGRQLAALSKAIYAEAWRLTELGDALGVCSYKAWWEYCDSLQLDLEPVYFAVN